MLGVIDSRSTARTSIPQQRILSAMWGLGALRDGAAGLVKQGAGAVKHGVEAGAKMLENLDEVRYKGGTALPSLFCDPI